MKREAEQDPSELKDQVLAKNPDDEKPFSGKVDYDDSDNEGKQ